MWCTQTGTCQPHTQLCEDGCTAGQVYCREAGQCQDLSLPCYGECVYQAVTGDHRQRFYCADTDTCLTGDQACNNTCLDTWGHPHLCSGAGICYSKNPSNPGKQSCDHYQALCGDDEWLCDGVCAPLSQPCSNNKPAAGRDGCIELYRGKKYGMALCEATNTCLHKFSPCNGSCSSSYPRLRYCQDTDTCINIARSCAGTCMVDNRVKCFTEDKCIHKNKINDGKFDCLGKTTY